MAEKLITTNRRAFRDYEVFETFEAGIELRGSEVKSLRAAKANLDDSFARIDNEEAKLFNAHITPYAYSTYAELEPTRIRKLLLHKAQIRKLAASVSQKGYTIVPLKMYFNERGFAKVLLALCKGKKFYDRREDIKKKESDLHIRRVMKNRKRK